MVLRSRGERFYRDDWNKDLLYAVSYEAFEMAMRDVYRWLRFKKESTYLDALAKEREKIFERARD